MTPDKPRYEVHQESLQGVWSLAHEEDGTQHFEDRARAEKLQRALMENGLVLRAVVTQVQPISIVNCAGARYAKRMGLTGKNVHITGDIKIKTPGYRRGI